MGGGGIKQVLGINVKLNLGILVKCLIIKENAILQHFIMTIKINETVSCVDFKGANVIQEWGRIYRMNMA